MSPSGRMTAAFGIGRGPATWLSCARSPSTSWAETEHPGSACGRVASRPPGMTSTCSLFWLDDFMRRPCGRIPFDLEAAFAAKREALMQGESVHYATDDHFVVLAPTK